MKPVIETVIDKNGGETTRFNPTSRMVLYAALKAEYPSEADADVCARGKMDPQLPGRWKTKYGALYNEWLEEAVDMHVDDDAKVLERVGMMQAVQAGNYQYWRDMARTKGVIKEPEGRKTILINTDFSALLAGGDFNSARARILSEVRGIGGPVAPPEPKTIEAVPVRVLPADDDMAF